MTLNDDRYNKLSAALGISSHTNDMLHDWLVVQTGGTGTNNDLWNLLFSQAGVPEGALQDRAEGWLTLQGIPAGALNDRWAIYWSSVDLDRDGLADTPVLTTEQRTALGINVTVDADSINIDIDGDGDADIILPRKP